MKAKYPDAKIEEAEEVTAGLKVTYEVEIETAKKKELEITLDASGRFSRPRKRTTTTECDGDGRRLAATGPHFRGIDRVAAEGSVTTRCVVCTLCVRQI